MHLSVYAAVIWYELHFYGSIANLFPTGPLPYLVCPFLRPLFKINVFSRKKRNNFEQPESRVRNVQECSFIEEDRKQTGKKEKASFYELFGPVTEQLQCAEFKTKPLRGTRSRTPYVFLVFMNAR